MPRCLCLDPVFYVYILFDGMTPTYVGKGKGRRWKFHKDGHSAIKAAQGLTEATALLLERELIEAIGRKDQGRGPLRNRTDGGQGVSGLRFSDAQKLKMRKPKKSGFREMRRTMMLGTKVSEETRAKHRAERALRNSLTPEIMRRAGETRKARAHKRSAEAIEKTTAALRGRKLAESTKELLRAANLGKKQTAETRQRVSAASKAAWTEERRAAFGLSRLGHRHTAETRLKMSESRIKANEARRACLSPK